MFCRLGGLAPSPFGYLFLSLLAYSLEPFIQARLSFSCIYLQATFLGYDNVCFTFPLPCQAITLWMQACCFTFPVPCLSHAPWVWQCLVIHSYTHATPFPLPLSNSHGVSVSHNHTPTFLNGRWMDQTMGHFCIGCIKMFTQIKQTIFIVHPVPNNSTPSLPSHPKPNQTPKNKN